MCYKCVQQDSPLEKKNLTAQKVLNPLEILNPLEMFAFRFDRFFRVVRFIRFDRFFSRCPLYPLCPLFFALSALGAKPKPFRRHAQTKKFGVLDQFGVYRSNCPWRDDLVVRTAHCPRVVVQL